MKKRNSGKARRSRRAIVAIVAVIIAICAVLAVALYKRSDTSQSGSPPPSPSPTPTATRDTSSPEAILNTYAQAFNARDADLMYSILSSESKRYNDLSEDSSYLSNWALVGDMTWTGWHVTSTTQDPYDNNARNLRVSFTSSESNPFGSGKITQTRNLTFKAVLENGEWLWDAGLSLILSG